MRVTFYLCVIITLSNCFNLNSQVESSILDKFYKEKLLELEASWNDMGYWGNAFEKKDNRFNESISYYLLMEEMYGLSYKNKIIKAIEFSFGNFQNQSGAMLQENMPSHIRTSLFLFGIAKAGLKYPELFNNLIVLNGIDKAYKYLKNQHEFSSNQNMAAMLSLYSLYNSTCDDKLYDLYMEYRQRAINDFIEVDEQNGYWPEAPYSWKNRLNTPYLLVQSFILQSYLLLTSDTLIQNLFNKQSSFLVSNINFDNCSINVRSSIGNFAKNKIYDLEISTASFFWIKNHKLSEAERNRLLLLCITFFNKEVKKAPVLLNTDTYFRFGLIYFL